MDIMGLALHFCRTQLLAYTVRSAASCGFEANPLLEARRVWKAPLPGVLVAGRTSPD